MVKINFFRLGNIDKAVGGNEICDLFSYKYQSLYNSVSYNQDDLNEVVKKLDSLTNNVCSKDHCYNSHSINVSMVTSAFELLKHNKSDGKVSSISNFIIYSPHILSVYLSLLFNSLIIHGFTPYEMLTGTIIPISKSKHKSIHDSSNYRGIALSSIFGKIVNNIILKSNSEVFKCCYLQFGFGSNHSTSQCTFVLKEIVQYYTNNDSNAYCMLLDASKAFDHVHYIKLFKLLIERGICPVIARFLLNLYTNQKLCIKWGTIVSPTFSVSNGVKQEGMLSPILFCVYMDELLYRLKLSGFGCHVGNISIPAIGYADDVALL